ncbi:hypothetical protein BDB00DRAFT_814245 [Zychaea mexicana]|uniref:uncharacterized protein n=1 Tax=Zychaea mexicana TaxID=64656 RepID=UPI0022FEF3E6|nr:uncharacterized protein BDB00DRAFT_814245 [Zychaea mexicana]KAI9495344.1 hypothetical protein BDB00DRAFT_814245 [Zychaea mexicana]
MPASRVFCCVPVRVGALAIASLLCVLYFASSIVMLVKRQGLKDWATMVQAVDVPLTDQAFDGVYAALVAVSLTYTLLSAYGVVAIVLRRRKLIQIYHVTNWFFVLLIMTVSLAYWFYFKVKRDVYINDCQDLQNQGVTPNGEIYTPVAVPGKNMIAGGSDKSHCISLVQTLVIVSGIVVFLGNFIQLYLASCIGTYASSLNWEYLHQRLQTQDIDELADRKASIDISARTN